MNETPRVANHEKYLLTVDEAARYFGIGVNKLRRIVAENMDSVWLLHNGRRVMIKRRLFEEYIDRAEAI